MAFLSYFLISPISVLLGLTLQFYFGKEGVLTLEPGEIFLIELLKSLGDPFFTTFHMVLIHPLSVLLGVLLYQLESRYSFKFRSLWFYYLPYTLLNAVLGAAPFAFIYKIDSMYVYGVSSVVIFGLLYSFPLRHIMANWERI